MDRCVTDTHGEGGGGWLQGRQTFSQQQQFSLGSDDEMTAVHLDEAVGEERHDRWETFLHAVSTEGGVCEPSSMWVPFTVKHHSVNRAKMALRASMSF